MHKTLFFFVEDFSSASKECFFEAELDTLVKRFDSILVLSLHPERNKALNYSHPKVKVIEFNYFAPCNRLFIFFTGFFSIFKVFAFEFIHTHNKTFYLRNAWRLLNNLIFVKATSVRLREMLGNYSNSKVVCYTYWCKQWTNALALIKSKNTPFKFVSRIHGGDYDEDQIHTTIPFRYFILSKIDKILPVSDYGKDYLMKKFAVPINKITTSRLGLTLPGKLAVICPNELIIVSCSSVIPLKRVNLIAEIINNIDIPCKWVHFGDGEDFEVLKSQVSGSKHSIQLMGYKPNHEFLKYLAENPVSLFINVSVSEGIPVSMMEAIAHGVPLMGTSVCGVPEIVCKTTGYLLPIDFNPQQVAKKIQELHTNKSLYDIAYRSNCLEFYKAHYRAKINHEFLAQELGSLN